MPIPEESADPWTAMLARLRADDLPLPERGTLPLDPTPEEAAEFERVWRKRAR